MRYTTNLAVKSLRSFSKVTFIASPPSMVKQKISVVIPMYNEEQTILTLFNRIPQLPNLEIIIVDDGSSDRCREIVQSLQKVKLICHKHNKGYGCTIRDGVSQATGDIIVTIDSDGQHNPEDIPQLIEPILNKRASFVIGSRYLGEYYYKLPLTTRLGEAFIEVLLRVFFGIKVKANQGGFRAFQREAARKIFGSGRFLGFAFATEVILQANISNYNVTEVPIRLHNRKHGKSRVKVVSLFFSLMNCLLYYGILKYLGKKLAEKFSSLLRILHLRQFNNY